MASHSLVSYLFFQVTYGLPFVQPILDFAHEFAVGTILRPFACVQIRTADGFFKAAVNKTFE